MVLDFAMDDHQHHHSSGTLSEASASIAQSAAAVAAAAFAAPSLFPSSPDPRSPSSDTSPSTPSHDSPIIAIPFPHQVGGHSPCGRVLKRALIAKLVGDGREKRFYESLLPESLKPFAPSFHGLANVLFNTDVYQSPLQFKYAKINETDSPSPSQDFLSDSGSSVNPWTLQLLSKCMKKHSVALDTEAVPCILLEDLCAKFEAPCILDLKIGKRMYRDGASEEKISRSIAKAEGSTSSSHGIRICGLQTYSRPSHTYYCQDKYVGRSLPGDLLKPSIARFFASCPPEYRQKTIGLIVDRLKQLTTAIEGITNLRFYSSSLLVVYEGNFAGAEDSDKAAHLGQDEEGESEADEHHTHKSGDAPRVDVRMIDFANTSVLDTAAADGQVPVQVGPDEGYLFGLRNLIKLLEEIIVDLDAGVKFNFDLSQRHVSSPPHDGDSS